MGLIYIIQISQFAINLLAAKTFISNNLVFLVNLQPVITLTSISSEKALSNLAEIYINKAI